MNRLLLLVSVGSLLPSAGNGQDLDPRIAELDKKLTAARNAASSLQRTIESLATELTNLRQGDKTITGPSAPSLEPTVEVDIAAKEDAFKNQMLGSELGGDQRENKLTARPELFIQSRFQT